MPKHETPLTRKYWEDNWKNKGATLIEEFPAVREKRKDGCQGRRLIDGIIVLDDMDGEGELLPPKIGLEVDGKEQRKGDGSKRPVKIKGRDIIVVQTKAERLGMNLLGQAFFSKFLMKEFNPKTIRSVAICIRCDDVMKDLAEKKGIEVWQDVRGTLVRKNTPITLPNATASVLVVKPGAG